MLFHAATTPQFPEKCIEPRNTRREGRLLGENSVTQEQAEQACASIESVIARGYWPNKTFP